MVIYSMPTQLFCRDGFWPIRRFALRGVLAASLAVTAVTAWGQEETPVAEKVAAAPAGRYKVLPPDPNERKKESEVRKMLMAGKFEAGQQEAFDAFFKNYFFPLWTDPQNYTVMTKESKTGRDLELQEELRKDLGNFFKAVKAGSVRDYFANLVLTSLGDLAKDNYHPVARFNAMLMIGELNQVEPTFGTSPAPLPAALPVLLATIADAKQIEAVKVAALRGIVRHANLGIANPQAREETVVPAVLQVAATRSAMRRPGDGAVWMRLLAIEALAAIRSPGNQGAVVKGLVSVAGETDAPLEVRMAASQALGALNYQPGAAPVSALQMATVLRELLLDGCTQMLDRQKKTGSPLKRRAVKELIHAVRVGLEGADEQHKGVSGLTTTDVQRTFIENVVQKIQAINDLSDNKDLEDGVLVERVTAAVAQLRGPEAGTAPAKPAAAATKPAAAKPAAAKP